MLLPFWMHGPDAISFVLKPKLSLLTSFLETLKIGWLDNQETTIIFGNHKSGFQPISIYNSEGWAHSSLQSEYKPQTEMPDNNLGLAVIWSIAPSLGRFQAVAKTTARNLSLGCSRWGSTERVVMNVNISVKGVKSFVLALLLKYMVRDSKKKIWKENMESKTTLNFFPEEGPNGVAHHVSSQRRF